MIEVAEIMDESEILSPKEYMKKLNIPTILAFLPKLYENNLQDFDASMYVQFCFYKGEWVKELFNFVSSGYGAALQKHRSVSWYVKGVRK